MHNSTLTGNDQNYVYSHKGALDSFRKIEQKEPAHLHFHPKRSGLRGRPEFIISHQIEHRIVYCYIIME